MKLVSTALSPTGLAAYLGPGMEVWIISDYISGDYRVHLGQGAEDHPPTVLLLPSWAV